MIPRVKLGDLDANGYPDVLVNLKYSNGSSIPSVVLNEKSHFSLNSTQYGMTFSKYTQTSNVAFFDLVENSMLDFLVVYGS